MTEGWMIIGGGFCSPLLLLIDNVSSAFEIEFVFQLLQGISILRRIMPKMVNFLIRYLIIHDCMGIY